MPVFLFLLMFEVILLTFGCANEERTTLVRYFAHIFLFSLTFGGILIGYKSESLYTERVTSNENPTTDSFDKKIYVPAFTLLPWLCILMAMYDKSDLISPFSSSPLIWITFAIHFNIFHFAMFQNNFFSTHIRIQKDREHVLCETGVYSIIRHPGYFGYMACFLYAPFLLSSFYVIPPALCGVIVVVLRTKYEDNLLTEQLNGYKEYQQKTKYRLIPFVW
jgi:protein-S-isoprenylcysteine O-methyltransferase Ste14